MTTTTTASLQTRIVKQFKERVAFKSANVEEAEEEAIFHTFELAAEDERDKTASSITIEELEQASRVLGRASTQAMNSIDMSSNSGGPGTPTCLVTHSKLIFVGTSNSMILTFDHFGTYRGVMGAVVNTPTGGGLRGGLRSAPALTSSSHQPPGYYYADAEENLLTSLSIAVPIRELERAGGTTSIDVLNHTNQLIAGYRDGRVLFWDATTSSIVKAVDPPGSPSSPISWVRFLGPSFAASCTRSGLISTIRLNKVFLVHTTDRRLLLDSSASPPLAFSAAHSHLAFTTASFSPQASATTFVTTTVRLEPDPPRVLQKLAFTFAESPPSALVSSSSNLLASTMPTCLSWGKIEDGGGDARLALAVSHGDSVHIIIPREEGGALTNVGIGVENEGTMAAAGPWKLTTGDESIVALEFIATNSLCFLTSSYQVGIFDAGGTKTVVARGDATRVQLVGGSFSSTPFDAGDDDQWGGGSTTMAMTNEAGDGVSQGKSRQRAMKRAQDCSNSVRAAPDESKLYFLGLGEIVSVRLDSWTQRVDRFTRAGRWREALGLCYRHKDDSEGSKTKCAEVVRGYVGEVRALDEGAAETVVAFARALDRADLLDALLYRFVEGRDGHETPKAEGSRAEATFVDCVVPMVLSGRLRRLSPLTSRSVMRVLDARGDEWTLQAVVLALESIHEVDLDMLVRKCKAKRLFFALARVQVELFRDFRAPLEELATATGEESRRDESVSLPQQVLVYLRLIFSGVTRFGDVLLPNPDGTAPRRAIPSSPRTLSSLLDEPNNGVPVASVEAAEIEAVLRYLFEASNPKSKKVLERLLEVASEDDNEENGDEFWEVVRLGLARVPRPFAILEKIYDAGMSLGGDDDERKEQFLAFVARFIAIDTPPKTWLGAGDAGFLLGGGGGDNNNAVDGKKRAIMTEIVNWAWRAFSTRVGEGGDATVTTLQEDIVINLLDRLDAASALAILDFPLVLRRVEADFLSSNAPNSSPDLARALACVRRIDLRLFLAARSSSSLASGALVDKYKRVLDAFAASRDPTFRALAFEFIHEQIFNLPPPAVRLMKSSVNNGDEANQGTEEESPQRLALREACVGDAPRLVALDPAQAASVLSTLVSGDVDLLLALLDSRGMDSGSDVVFALMKELVAKDGEGVSVSPSAIEGFVRTLARREPRSTLDWLVRNEGRYSLDSALDAVRASGGLGDATAFLLQRSGRLEEALEVCMLFDGGEDAIVDEERIVSATNVAISLCEGAGAEESKMWFRALDRMVSFWFRVEKGAKNNDVAASAARAGVRRLLNAMAGRVPVREVTAKIFQDFSHHSFDEEFKETLLNMLSSFRLEVEMRRACDRVRRRDLFQVRSRECWGGTRIDSRPPLEGVEETEGDERRAVEEERKTTARRLIYTHDEALEQRFSQWEGESEEGGLPPNFHTMLFRTEFQVDLRPFGLAGPAPAGVAAWVEKMYEQEESDC